MDTPPNLKNVGRIRVLRALHDAGSLSRQDLVVRTGLSRGTVAALVAELVDQGMLEEQDPDHSLSARVGRPPQTLTIVDSAAYVIGLDIGHSHLHVLLCDARGNPLWERRVARPVDLEPGLTLDTAADLVREAMAAVDVPPAHILGVGVAIASPVGRDQEVAAGPAIMPGWGGLHPAHDLTARVGLPATLVNDANAGATAELLYGAGRDASDLVFVRLSEGIGAGIVADGRLLVGGRGMAGEVGHLQVIHDGLICRCGNRGCLETIATPTSIARLLSDSWGTSVAPGTILDLVAQGDRGARRAVEDAGRMVGHALSAAVTLFDPTLIVVGGDLALAGDVILEPLRQSLLEHSLGFEGRRLDVVAGELLAGAEVRGAAAVVLDSVPEALLARHG